MNIQVIFWYFYVICAFGYSDVICKIKQQILLNLEKEIPLSSLMKSNTALDFQGRLGQAPFCELWSQNVLSSSIWISKGYSKEEYV
jgi:hypothetical protein